MKIINTFKFVVFALAFSFFGSFFTLNASRPSLRERLKVKAVQRTPVENGLIDGLTPIMYAITIGLPDNVGNALRGGANVDSLFPDGMSLYNKSLQCLQFAHELRDVNRIAAYTEILETLAEYGAKDAKTANDANKNDQKKASPKSKENKKKKNKSQAPAVGSATTAASAAKESAEPKNSKQSFTPDEIVAALALAKICKSNEESIGSDSKSTKFRAKPAFHIELSAPNGAAAATVAATSEKHAKSAERDEVPVQERASVSAADYPTQEASAAYGTQGLSGDASKDQKTGHEIQSPANGRKADMSAPASSGAQIEEVVGEVNVKASLSLREKRDIIRLTTIVGNSSQLIAYLSKHFEGETQIAFAAQTQQRAFAKYFSYMKKQGRSFEFALSCFGADQLKQINKLLLMGLRFSHPQVVIIDDQNYALKTLRKMYNSVSPQSYSDVDTINVFGERMSQPVGQGLVRAIDWQRESPELAKKFDVIGEQSAPVSTMQLFGVEEESVTEFYGGLFDQHAFRLRESLEKAKIKEADASLDEMLLYAVINGHIDDVRLLVTVYKANPNCRDSKGRVPLLLAWEPEIRLLLKGAGASVDFQDPQGRTALMTACEIGAASVVEDLLTKTKANFKLEDMNGKRAYALAHESLRKLLDDGVAGKYEKHIEAQMLADHEAKLKCAEDDRQQKESEKEQLRLDKEAKEKQLLLDQEAVAQKVTAKALKDQKKKVKKLALRKLNKELEEAELKRIDENRAQENAREAERLARQKANKRKEAAQKIQSICARAQTRMERAALNTMKTFAKDARKEANTKNMQSGAQKAAALILKHSASAAFRKMRRNARYSLLRDEATAGSMDADLHLRVLAFQSSINLYAKCSAMDKQTNKGKIAQAEANMISAASRMADYYVRRGLNSNEVIKAMKDFQDKRVKEVGEIEAGKTSRRYNFVEWMWNNLQNPSTGFNKGKSVEEMMENLFKFAKQSNSNDEASLRLIDAVRAQDSAAVETMLASGSVSKFSVPLFYANLYENNELAASLARHALSSSVKRLSKQQTQKLSDERVPRSAQLAGLSTAASAGK